MAAILYGIVTYLLQQVVLKVIVYGILFLFVTEAVNFLTQYMTSGDGGIASAITGMGGSFTFQGQTIAVTPFIDYLLNYFLVPQWLQAVLTAYATVFLIRRIPFIG
jgi:hypothetical protein